MARERVAQCPLTSAHNRALWEIGSSLPVQSFKGTRRSQRGEGGMAVRKHTNTFGSSQRQNGAQHRRMTRPGGFARSIALLFFERSEPFRACASAGVGIGRQGLGIARRFFGQHIETGIGHAQWRELNRLKMIAQPLPAEPPKEKGGPKPRGVSRSGRRATGFVDCRA